MYPPWLPAVSKINNQATRDLLLKFVHIKPSPDETNHTDVLHSLAQLKPRNLVSFCSYMRDHWLRRIIHALLKILNS